MVNFKRLDMGRFSPALDAPVISAWQKQDKEPRKLIDCSEKKCGRCKEVRDASYFWKDKSRDTGLDAYCIPCRKMFPKYERIKVISQAQWEKQRIQICKDKINYWNNELTKLQRGIK